MADESTNVEPKLPETDDEQNGASISTPADLENSPNLAEKVGADALPQSEWTWMSSLQIVGAFMLLFNSYVSKLRTWLTRKMGIFESFWSISELL